MKLGQRMWDLEMFLFCLFFIGKKVTSRMFSNENDPIERKIDDAGDRGELVEQYSCIGEGMRSSAKWKGWLRWSTNSLSIITGEKEEV